MSGDDCQVDVSVRKRGCPDAGAMRHLPPISVKVCYDTNGMQEEIERRVFEYLQSGGRSINDVTDLVSGIVDARRTIVCGFDE